MRVRGLGAVIVFAAAVALPAGASAQAPGVPAVAIPGDPLAPSVDPFTGTTAIPRPVGAPRGPLARGSASTTTSPR